MDRNLALGGEGTDHELIESPNRVPIDIAEVIARDILFVGFKLDAPGLGRARDQGFAGPVPTRGPYPQPQPVQLAKEGEISQRHDISPINSLTPSSLSSQFAGGLEDAFNNDRGIDVFRLGGKVQHQAVLQRGDGHAVNILITDIGTPIE